MRASRRSPSYGSVLGAMARHLTRLSPEAPPTAAASADPFRVLVATIISTRTKDAVTSAAAERLHSAAPDPRRLAALPEARIARLIFPAGFYRSKAANLRASARMLLERHAGRVPQRMEDLLELPGVGRKVANLVRGAAFGIAGICVDTHVHRISNRLGWVATSDAAGTELALMRVLPRRYWIVVNELLVRWGQAVCTPRFPRCGSCPVTGSCQRRGVARAR